MRRALGAAALVALSSSGCLVTAETSFRDKALGRVAFELNCPVNAVSFGVLVRNDGLGCAGSQVAVTGCGKRAVYTCDASQVWTNTSGVLVGR